MMMSNFENDLKESNKTIAFISSWLLNEGLLNSIDVREPSTSCLHPPDIIIYQDEKMEKLKSFENKEIVLGIRPEAFEDGRFANESDYSQSINVKVSLLEQLGSDSYVHFYKDIKPVQTEAIEEILADEGEDITVLGDNTKFIARINPNSTVTEGEEIELKINPSKLHFFDPESGDVI